MERSIHIIDNPVIWGHIGVGIVTTIITKDILKGVLRLIHEEIQASTGVHRYCSRPSCYSSDLNRVRIVVGNGLRPSSEYTICIRPSDKIFTRRKCYVCNCRSWCPILTREYI